MIAEFLARTLYNRGLRALNDADLHRATRAFHASLGYAPASAPTWLSLGNAYMEQNDVELALGCFRKAAQLTATQQHLPLINCADALLKLGQWEEGWRLYELRYASPGFTARNGLPNAATDKLWRGESLEGKTLLLFNEQGAGDTIMMLRYVRYAVVWPDKLILRLPASLIKLARATFRENAKIEIVSDTQRLPPYDLFAPYMSLPLRAQTTPRSIWPDRNYLSLYNNEPPVTFNPTLTGFRVGIVWAGSPGHPRDSERSIPLDMMRPLLEMPGVSWVSLQAGPKAKEIAQFPHVRTVPTRDFYETACAMRALDLVITVDSSPAHLAGALGVPVWTLLPFAPDFRWMLNRVDTPWYASMSLYRQPTRGDWASVIENVRAALVRRMDSHSRGNAA